MKVDPAKVRANIEKSSAKAVEAFAPLRTDVPKQICGICGAVLADQQRHDEWHENLRTSLEIVAEVLERMDTEAPDGQ